MFDVRLVEIRALFATFDRLQGFDQRLSQFGSVTSVKDVPVSNKYVWDVNTPTNVLYGRTLQATAR